MRLLVPLLTLATVWSCAAALCQTPPPRTGARINNLKVLSSSVDDVTTPENILKSFVKPGMSDAQRTEALWKAAVRYRHQTAPPNEFLAGDWEAHDPVKLFNVYGYCMCCCCSSILEALNRLDGRETRGRILNGHSVPEVNYGDAWHMYDCSLITLFPKPDASMASVDDISKAVKDWYAQNPGYEGNGGKLFDLMRANGWTGWKDRGPALLAASPYNTLGYYPARTHGWDATMTEYNRKSEVYDYGYQLGHRALFSLRPGESLIREAGNRGLHVNGDPGFDMLKAHAPENDLVYLKQFLPGYTGGVVGNGVQRYAPNLAAGELAQGALTYANLTAGTLTGGKPAISVAKPGQTGVAIVDMNSPYVYLDGRVKVATTCASGDSIVLSLSTNNGLAFTPVWTTRGAPTEANATIALGPRILRRYAYQLKLEIHAASLRGTGITGFVVENDFQHAPRTVPWLKKGDNTITIAADADTALAARTFTGRITSDKGFDKNESTGTLGVVFDNLKVDDGSCWWTGGVGTMTVPIETPGNMAALRFGAQIRARGERDLVKMQLSFDEGKSWKEAARIEGPTPGTTRYFRTADIPPHTRKALLRYELTGNNTVGIFSFRADADYHDPLAAPAFRSFTVTHRWKEAGREKSFAKVVDRLPLTYTIPAGDSPEMVSVAYEMTGAKATRQAAAR
jgi:hypothetical protein